MRLLGTVVLGVMAAAVIDCGGESNQGGSANGGAPDGSVADAAAGASQDDDSGSTANGGSSGSGGSGGGQGNDVDASEPEDACPDTADEAFGLVGDNCDGSDVCVYSNVNVVGECYGTFVSACVSGAWSSQCFPGDAGPLECTPLDDPDAGPQSLRVCSEDPRDPVLWAAGTLPSGEPTCGPIPQPRGCQLPWGCGSFENSRISLAQCDGGPFVDDEHSARGWGYLILEDHLGLIVRRGYYDETTGELVGTWIREGMEETCSGTIPRDSANGSTTNHVALCLPDGGVITDGATPSDGG